jgi:hypothetical protein
MLELDDEGNSAPPGKHVTGHEHKTAPPNGDGPARSPGGVGHETLANVAEPEAARGATGVTALDEDQASAGARSPLASLLHPYSSSAHALRCRHPHVRHPQLATAQ